VNESVLWLEEGALPIRTRRDREGGKLARTNTNGRAWSPRSSCVPSRPRY